MLARSTIAATLRSTSRIVGSSMPSRAASASLTLDSCSTLKYDKVNNNKNSIHLLIRKLSSYRITIPAEHCTPVKEGDAVPSMSFRTRVRIQSDEENPFGWLDVKSDDLFRGNRVVLFALPGAFTPTCSTSHLPGYEAAYDEIRKLDIDEVYCLSVNDAFVMRQWGLYQGLTEDMTVGTNGFKNVKLLPDGAAEFTRGMGMSTMWDEQRGFGERSWRYSVVINDMKVEKIFIEGGGVTQNSGPDPFEVSDAKTMVEYLKQKA